VIEISPAAVPTVAVGKTDTMTWQGDTVSLV